MKISTKSTYVIELTEEEARELYFVMIHTREEMSDKMTELYQSLPNND